MFPLDNLAAYPRLVRAGGQGTADARVHDAPAVECAQPEAGPFRAGLRSETGASAQPVRGAVRTPRKPRGFRDGADP